MNADELLLYVGKLEFDPSTGTSITPEKAKVTMVLSTAKGSCPTCGQEWRTIDGTVTDWQQKVINELSGKTIAVRVVS